MSSKTQTFDPNGDVVLVFNQTSETKTLAQVNMLVSSKHMILASPVFAAMLKVEFKEGSTLESKGHAEILLPDDDPQASIILLNIIHGRPKKVPRRIDLLLLQKLAILVDKYQMQEVVAVFSEIWIGILKDTIPKASTTDLLSWVCISWVFEDDPVFKRVTKVLMQASDSALDPDLVDELPIPTAVFDRIQYERYQGAISGMVREVYSLFHDYHKRPISCKRLDGEKPACDAMVLGSLLKLAQNAQIWPQPEFPCKGVSVDGLKKNILAVEIRTLCDITDRESGLKIHQPVSSTSIFTSLTHQKQQSLGGQKASQAIKEFITSKINSVCDRLCGLSIKEFK